MDLSEKIKKLQPSSLTCISCCGHGIRPKETFSVRLLSDEVKKCLVEKGKAEWCPVCNGTGQLKHLRILEILPMIRSDNPWIRIIGAIA